MNIPRYTASFPLQTEFITNADATGDHVFTQMRRQGNVAIYRRNEVGSTRAFGFEVVLIKTVKAGTVFAKGAKPTEKDYESYPGGKSFGKSAWFYSTESKAEEKFEELVKNEQPEVTYTIPNTIFTLVEFSKVNSLPVNSDTAKILSKLISERKVLFKGKNDKGLQIFSKN